ncbi:hypothetical protein WDU94_015061 [Cyamophila willieti]
MNDPMKELWKKINEVHCLYIESDESPEKIEYESELGALIHEFLSIVPHNCKFHFTDTHHVLRRSILSNPDVNHFKLAKAWLSMSKYASNLISQPWRKEYTIIKLYSGFYKHQIEPVLLGGEVILELMGYRQTQPGHMELLEPIDGDTVRVVALDTLMAMVECQILRLIYEDVAKHLPSISWKDIIEARELYTGSPEIIRNKLLTKFSYPSTRQHCRSNSYGTACNAAYPAPVQCNGYASSMPLHSAYLPTSTMNGYYCQHYTGHNVPVNYPCNVPSGKLIDLDPPPYRTPDSYTRSPLTSSDEVNLLPGPSGINHKPRDESWGYVLDTLDKPSTSSNNSKKYSTASNGGDRYSGVAADRYNMNTISAGGSGESITRCLEGMKSLRLEDNQLRGGASTGQGASRGSTVASVGQPALSVDEIDVGGGEGGRKYRGKEERFGEDTGKYRGKEERYVEDREKYRSKDDKYVEREYGREAKTSFRRDSDREREREKELDRERERERDYKKKEKEMMERMREVRNSISPDAQYEVDENIVKRIEDSGHQYAPLRVNLTPETGISSGLRVNLTPETSNPPSEGSTRSWNCEFCTYMNKAKKDICEMCGKSRNSAIEIKPLESGGRQCPKCTLVNDKEANKCEACDASLEHSATYI